MGTFICTDYVYMIYLSFFNKVLIKVLSYEKYKTKMSLHAVINFSNFFKALGLMWNLHFVLLCCNLIKTKESALYNGYVDSAHCKILEVEWLRQQKKKCSQIEFVASKTNGNVFCLLEKRKTRDIQTLDSN